MPTPAQYKAGGKGPREAREDADEHKITEHHRQIFSKVSVMDHVKLVILAGHRHGSFSMRERMLLGFACDSFGELCESCGIAAVETVETKSMYGTNQPWNLEKIRARNDAVFQIDEAISALKAAA